MADSFGSHEWLELATGIQADVDRNGLGIPNHLLKSRDVQVRSPLDQFDDIVTSQDLVRVSRKLFADGHYANAVEDAFKCLNNAVKEKAQVSSDGDALMRRVFSANSPILQLNSFQSDSDHNEQRGYMDIFAGVMTGIRNPRAHEHEIVDDPKIALEMLIIANHLMRKLEASTLADLHIHDDE